MNSGQNKARRLAVREIVLFGMYGGLMYALKMAMQVLPNIHPLGLFIVALTAVYRRKALYPIYVYVLLEGLFAGFALWWVPYLYMWILLWGAVMLLPRDMSDKAGAVVYPAVSALHGLLFGILYTPAQVLLYGLPLKSAFAWIVAGFPYDCIHAAGNLVLGLLILPLVKLMRTIGKTTHL